MRIAVIDDEKPARDELEAIIHDYDKNISVDTFASAERVLEMIADHPIDLAFVDINMMDMDGITLAKLLKKLQDNIEIIFATAYNNYAKEAFEVEAFGYILKPYEDHKIIQLIKKCRIEKESYEKELHTTAQINTQNQIHTQKLSLNIQKKTVIIDIQDIVYAEIVNRSCVIHTTKGDYVCNYTMNLLEEKLKNYDFYRIQKSFLIHLKYMTEIYPWFNNTTCVKIKGYEDKVITVGRAQVKGLKSLFD